MAVCAGSPTFLVSSKSPNRFVNEWPADFPSVVCKTPPFGKGSHPRFTQCCSSGHVHNITTPTVQGEEGYPATCGIFCHVLPKDLKPAEGGLSPYMMCITNNGDDEMGDYEVVCDTSNIVDDATSSPTLTASSTSGTSATSTPLTTVSGTTSTLRGTTTAPTTTIELSTSTGSPSPTATPSSGIQDIKLKGLKTWVVGMALLFVLA